jgi:integrase
LAKRKYAEIVTDDTRFRNFKGEMSFDDLAHRFLEEIKHQKSIQTSAGRMKRLQNFFRGRRIGTVTREDAVALREKLKAEVTSRGTERASATVNRHLQLLRAMFNLAVRHGWLTVNPLAQARLLLRENLSTPRILSDDELERIFNACTGDLAYMKSLLEFLLLSGCRPREVLLLEWRDIDWQMSRVHLRNTKVGHDRIIAMGMRLRQVLTSIPRLSDTWVFVNPQTLKPYGHTSKRFNIFRPTFPEKMWRRVLQQAGITDPDVTVYCFRRTAATLLAKQLGLHEAARVLGHVNLSTTTRYAAVTSDVYDKAAELLEEKVRQAAS